MSPTALDALRARIQRALTTVQRRAAGGYTESHILDDGQRHWYSITGIKSPEQLQDELLTLFIWLWSLKDYLKAAYRAKNLDPQMVEDVVNDCAPLKYVADIANRAKHGELRQSRSRHFATLTDVGITSPQCAISTLRIGAYNVGMDISKPEEAVLRASVQPEGRASLDAFAVLTEAIEAWETRVLPRIAT